LWQHDFSQAIHLRKQHDERMRWRLLAARLQTSQALLAYVILHRTFVLPSLPMLDAPADYLSALNPEQRQAVEHGAERNPEAASGPLLIIAGAGSGKTNTLAYRVAHLLFRGADPQRILLLTFSRRAAAEMERRTGQIIHRVVGAHASRQPPALRWSGTFHAIGARLLREYAPRIGLYEAFTIHDRSDSEDQLAIVRHELGLSATQARFPGKAT